MDEPQYKKIAAYQKFPTKRADAENLLAVVYPDRMLDGVSFAEQHVFDIFTKAHELYQQAKARKRDVAQCQRDYLRRLERMANTPAHEWGTKSISKLEEELGLV